MPTYSVASITVTADIDLPELIEVAPAPASWTLESMSMPIDPAADRFDIGCERLSARGRVWLEAGRDESRYLLRFPELADFVVAPAERLVTCSGHEGTGPATLRHLFLDHVVPRLLTLDGSLVLHASAVVTQYGALAFAGASGSGKSSLAASFAAEGAAVLADDFVLLTELANGFVAQPSYPGVRLWPDSTAALGRSASSRPAALVTDGSDKRRVVPGPFAGRPVQLGAVILLGTAGDEDTVDVRRLSAREGFVAVLDHAFRMERQARERHRADFDRFARLAASTPIFRLDYRRTYESLSEVRARVVGTAGGGRD